jgi:hypothetical protein
MLRNYLTESGTLTCIEGNDAYAPYPYWTSYAYKSLTTNELNALKNNNYDTTAFTLASGQYTCLEVTVSGSIFLGALRCYFGNTVGNYITAALSIEQPSFYSQIRSVSCSNIELLDIEDVKGSIAYWRQIEVTRGYFESEQIPLITANPVTLVSADYYSSTEISLPDSRTLTSQSIRQIMVQPSGLPQTNHISVTLSGAQDGSVDLSHVSIAPIDITVSSTSFDPANVQDHAVRGNIRHWVSDDGKRGHFEGDPILLDVGQSISGTWIQDTVWQGTGTLDAITNKQGYAIRQLIPGTEITSTNDGIRITLQSAAEDVVIRNISYMPATSTSVRLDFQTNSTFEQRNIKGPIVRWKNDGWVTGVSLQNVDFADLLDNLNIFVAEYEAADVLDYLEIERSHHFGHFEGGAVDFDDGQAAIMYNENVIGFRATNHGLVPGDYITVEGTEYYDGHYIVLTFSTAHIVVVWGIYDPEVFTSAAKMRKIISIGPQIDDYGQKQDARDVIPYVQINFLNGHTAYIINSNNYGKNYASVELSTIEDNTEISSIYDVFYDSSGYLSSSPGPSVTPEYETSMPDFSSSNLVFKPRTSISRFLDLGYDFDDPGRAYSTTAAESWSGDFFVVCEPQDPEFEGDWTGWTGERIFFDRQMAQPWYTLLKDDCPWVTLCYRGQTPVKFGFDLGSPKVFSKYRMWVQLWLCGAERCAGISCSKPKSWKFQATNTPDDEDSWVTLEHVIDYDADLYTPSLYPPDRQIPGSCGVGDWLEYPTVELYCYYRLYVYDAWLKVVDYAGIDCHPTGVEASHICELDFCEHRTAPGVFPTVVTSTIFFDKVNQILPNEHLRSRSTAYYSLSFDGGQTWYIYEQDHWRVIAKNDNGTWKYYRDYWRTADENNARKALWHAFSTGVNRMTSVQLSSVPQDDYRLIMASGCYPQFGVGLVSDGVIESLLDGITIKGIAYNPVGTAPPAEFLFSGESGCTISGGYNTVASDWLNIEVPEDFDILLSADIDSLSGALSRLTDYTDYRYFERPKFASYDEQVVVVSDFTSQSGVVLVKDIEVRKSDLVIFPATNNGLQVSDWVTITGTSYYNKLYDVKYAVTNFFGVTDKHLVETVSTGAFARPLVTIAAPGSHVPDVQVGSIVEFSESSSYLTTEYREVAPSGLYWVTENTCQPGKEATYAFDSDSTVEFHSGRSIDKGPVIIGLNMTEQRTFTNLRIKASSNYYYWDVEFPQNFEVSASNLNSPSLENESHWIILTSGVCVLPVAPNRHTDYIPITSSGAYYNYRLKINSIHGDSNYCVRFGKLEFSDSRGSNIGFTIVDAKQGFDARYLFDGTTYSQYVSKYPMSSGVINIGINYRYRPVQITGFQVTSVKDSVTAGTETLPWRKVSPKSVSFWSSILDNPRLDVDADWVKMIRVDYDKPGDDLPSGGEGVTGPLVTIPYSPKDSLRRTEGYTVVGNTAPSSRYLLVDVSWSLDNGYVIDRIGIYSAGVPNSNCRFKLCKNTDDLNWEVVMDLGPITYSGAGLNWTILDSPLEVPSAGDYHIGFWQYGGVTNCEKTGQSGKHMRTSAYLSTAPVTGPEGAVQLPNYFTDHTLQVAVQYMAFNDFPSSATNYKLKIESVWGGTSYHAELADMSLETTEGYEATTLVTYSGVTYPTKLLDVPAYYKVTGLTITAVSGVAGGYTEVDGNPDTASGTFTNSFWTIVDRHWNLDNGKAIAYVGVDSDLSSNISFRIFKDRDGSGEWYDIWSVASFTHSGGGFQWFKLTNPYEIPNDGVAYHLGWYQPNYPRMMGDATGSGLVSYQYGDYTGTNIHLSLHSNQRPHLAVRYATSFTVGSEGDNDNMYPLFCPGTAGHQYISSSTFGPFTTASAIYLYRPITPIAPDTQGITTYTFYYEDTRAGHYDAWPYTISGSPSFESTHFAQHVMDGDPSTFFYSYRKLDETQHLYFIVRFDDPAYINTYRLQTSTNYNYYLEHFPTMITIGASNLPLNLLSSDGWEELYFDDGFLSPRSKGSLLPWVYFDDYDDSYRYFRFDFCHSNYAEGYSSIGEMYLLLNQPYQQQYLVTEPYNVIRQITGSGIAPASVEMLYHPGSQRLIQEVYNTFTYGGISEPSPGSYFYYGQNNLNTTCPTPVRIFRDDPDNPEEIPFTVTEVGNTNILAWHTLDEETGDYGDLSGNNVIGARVGPVLSTSGKCGNCAYISDDNADEERNIRFSLPPRLTEYTVAFWFKPGHTLDVGYDLYYDIMGGWTSYGAIPGIWHISYAQDLLFDDSPYPYLQYKTSNYMSRLVFGNYGKAIYTGRYRWPSQTWHHIAFAFRTDSSMRAWIDGAPDIYTDTRYSDVYPSDSVIMVDPDDIHYSERDKANCMYFGLPLKGSDGVKGEFALDNVMHFNKYLTDEEVFNLYRLRYPTVSQDGLYFAKATTLRVPGRVIVDFGREVCITRYGMRSSYATLAPGPETKWLLEALDPEVGWKVLSETYDYVPPPTASLSRKEEEILLTASGTFPQKVFTLRESIESLEISFTVEEAFKGGWYSALSDIPMPVGGSNNLTFTANNTFVFAGLPTGVPGNTYVSQIGMYSTTAISGIKYKATFHWAYNTHSVLDICSGINHPGSGTYWYALPSPYLIPASGAYWDLGLCLPSTQTATGFQGNGSNYLRACNYAFKSGDIVGDRVVGWTYNFNSGGTWYYYIAYDPKVAIRISPTYFLQEYGRDTLTSSQFAASGITTSWSGVNTFPDATSLYLFSNAVVGDTQGTVRVKIVYYERDEKPAVPWNDLVNTKFYQYYGISIVGLTTCATGINISSLHFSDVPFIHSVSGNYTTTFSGLDTNGKYIPFINKFMEKEEFVDIGLSRDNQSSWFSVSPSGIPALTHGDLQAVGSGNLSIAHTFHSLPSISGIRVYPYSVAVTDWSLLAVPSPVYFSGGVGVNIPAQTVVVSDYAVYTSSGNQWDMVILDVTSGKASYSEGFSNGYLQLDGESYNLLSGGIYTPSGLNLVSNIVGRYNDTVSIPVTTTNLISGDFVDITELTYSGVFPLVLSSGSYVHIQTPLYSEALSTNSYLRKVILPENKLIGMHLDLDTSSGIVIEKIAQQEITLGVSYQSEQVKHITNLISQSSGTALSYTKTFTEIIGGEAYRTDYLGMVANDSPPYKVYTDYNDTEELVFTITENTTFPYKLLSLPVGETIENISIEIIGFAKNAYEFVGDGSAGDLDNPYDDYSLIDGTMALDVGKELRRVGLYTTTPMPLIFSVWEDCFDSSPSVSFCRNLVTGTHLGNGFNCFDVVDPFVIPEKHGRHRLGVCYPFRVNLDNCAHTSIGSVLYCAETAYFPGLWATSEKNYLSLYSQPNYKLAIRADYSARFSIGYSDEYSDFFVPYFTAASGTLVTPQGPLGPYPTSKDVNLYFHGDILESVNLKITITKQKDTYLVLDGLVDDYIATADVVLDLGETNKFDKYRFLPGETSSGWTWYISGANELPYWTTLSGYTTTTTNNLFTNRFELFPDYRYYAFKFDSSVALREVQFLNTLSLSSGIACASTSSGTEWEYNYVARIVNIDVNSSEPSGTALYHAVTFDSGNTYKVFDTDYWLPVIRNNVGQWEYYNNAWTNAPQNNKFSALRSLIDVGDYKFSSVELEQVEESEWHVTGGATSSGTLGFIQYFEGSDPYTPIFYGYEIHHVTRSGGTDTGWLSSLTPSGYGYTVVTQSGVRKEIDIPFRIDSGYETIYGRIETEKFRVYLANPSASGIPISELAVLDVQLPDHPYYTVPFTYPTHLYPIMSSGVQISELHDEHVRTGGIILQEQQVVDYQIQDIPAGLGLFYGELRVYFTKELDSPRLISVAPDVQHLLGTISGTSFLPSSPSGLTFCPTYSLYDDYYSVYFWSEDPLSQIAVRVGNTSVMGSGISRINELAIFPVDSDQGWDIPDEFNHLASADTTNVVSMTYVTSSGVPWVSMTGYSSPDPFKVYESSPPAGPAFPAWKLFSTVESIWEPPAAAFPQWVILDIGDPYKGYRVFKYRIKGCNSSGFWSDSWKLEGSNNMESWFLVDSRSSTSFPGDSTWTQYFNVQVPGFYRYYRITFLTYISNSLQIYDIDYQYDYYSDISGEPQVLSVPHMERLFDPTISGALPLLPNYYIGLESRLTRFGGKSKEWRCYIDDSSVNVALFTQVSGSSTWISRPTTWSGVGYFYSDFGYETITATKFSCLNTSSGVGYDSIRWLRSLMLINSGEEINFGPTGSGTNLIDLPTTYARYEQVKIYNDNRSGTYANARVLPRFSNNYHLDRLALISEDQTNWSHLDIGTNLPEDYEFSVGKFVHTEVSDGGGIQLDSTSTSGHWVSPVIEVLDPSSTAGHVYCKNLASNESYVAEDYQSVMNVVEVRSSNTKPMHSFLATAVDTSSTDGLQCLWKMVAFDSDGRLSSWNARWLNDTTNLNRGTNLATVGAWNYPMDAPRRYWEYTTRPPLWQFYGFLDSRRYGAISLGQEYANSYTITENGYYRNEDWYKGYYICPYGSNFSSSLNNPQILHKYPRTNAFLFPIFTKALRYTNRVEGGVPKEAFHFVDAVMRTQPFYERFQEYYYSDSFFHLRNIYGFQGNASTPESDIETDYLYSFPGKTEALGEDGIRFGSCIDNHSDSFSYWVHYAHEYGNENYYRTLLITNERVEKEFSNIELKFNYIVEGSYSAPRGFWGLSERAVYWLEYDGGTLSVRYSVSADALGKEFKLVTFGNIDYNNNLWFVDLVTERVIRVNFEALETGGQPVDYTRAIDGAVSVYPDPYDGSAYVYVIRDPEFPTNDCVKIVHVGDYDYIIPETVCIVPGTAIVESYNVNFYGRSTTPHGYYDVLPNDVVWKDNGTAQWERYSAGSPTLPKGHYKQLKVTLRRKDLESISPEVEYIRIPKPALLNKIPWKGYRDVFIDTIPHQEEVDLAAGDYTLDLLVWWPRE